MLVNSDLLRLFGRANGPQHDECRVGISFLGMRFKWREKPRSMVQNATVHWSVRQRFDEPQVLVYDCEMPYRPELLRQHVDYAARYDKPMSS